MLIMTDRSEIIPIVLPSNSASLSAGLALLYSLVVKNQMFFVYMIFECTATDVRQHRGLGVASISISSVPGSEE
ncbi:hypothetical protein M404DRAFT_31185 [Pisolithus tinctorius Marx 270]|uniref:Uncharacterized protein n=1 Tax=Pisolithus tinctorius Marx 270 TaxID=870435 RepID=A0A0C3NC39_PISTI|nr:hypothetical protein M404DRAFT_31185 [Pisolithus tinctorius Marx 270]